MTVTCIADAVQDHTHTVHRVCQASRGPPQSRACGPDTGEDGPRESFRRPMEQRTVTAIPGVVM